MLAPLSSKMSEKLSYSIVYPVYVANTVYGVHAHFGLIAMRFMSWCSLDSTGFFSLQRYETIVQHFTNAFNSLPTFIKKM